MLGSIVMDGREISFEPLAGWKVLELSVASMDLFGPYYDQLMMGEFVPAKCDVEYPRHAHTAPDPEGMCRCGFNIFKERSDAERALESLSGFDGTVQKNDLWPDGTVISRWETPVTIPVLCRVEAWGRVVEYHTGYRSQYQRIVEVFLPVNDFISAQDVRSHLQIDVTEVDYVKGDKTAVVRRLRRDKPTNHLVFGKETEIEMRIDKRGLPYTYQGFPAKFNPDSSYAQLQVRAVLVFWNAKSKTFTVKHSVQLQVLRAQVWPVWPCRFNTYVFDPKTNQWFHRRGKKLIQQAHGVEKSYNAEQAFKRLSVEFLDAIDILDRKREQDRRLNAFPSFEWTCTGCGEIDCWC